MVVDQTSTYFWFRVLLTGAMLGLLPSAGALAQNAIDDPAPLPQNPASTENYSLPPGQNSRSDQDVVQGPVDEDVPQIEPSLTVPRNSPVNTPQPIQEPRAGASTAMPVAAENTPSQEPVSQVPAQSRLIAEPSPPNAALSPRDSGSAEVDSQEPVDTSSDINLSPSDPLEEPETVASSASGNWFLWAVAALLFALISAAYLWRARRTSMKQSITIEAENAGPSLPDHEAKPLEPLQSAPAITLGFQPHSANATLINAVLGFELTLSNLGSEILTDLKVTGTMVQAKDECARDLLSADLSPLQDIEILQIGKTEKVSAEFRVPLVAIHPILFRSQALFVPLVHLSIEFTDGSDFRHFQTATYLVGQEHEPQRTKMAPFRLDLGPCSFAPLGHRPIVMG
ncbi:MAG: hypothetical protein ABJ082_06850 [Parasphingorhabdus sp.]|uniref:hypothetical protein n=1 Tax=Parasphingorhabdus sp. TaxID=2709688 RepID=UPI003267CB3A